MKKLILITFLLLSIFVQAQKPQVDYIRWKKVTTVERDAIDVSKTTVVYEIFNVDTQQKEVYNSTNGTWQAATASVNALQVPIDPYLSLESLNVQLQLHELKDELDALSLGAGTVTSVFGRAGTVTAQSGDYNADEITETATRVFVTPTQKGLIDTALQSYTETDPIFSAWDKSTGISITESQISDLNHTVNTDNQTALEVPTDTANFNGNLSGIDTTVQAALDTIDDLVLGGGGNVTKVSTPVNNQIGVWTGDGTIEGTQNFTFDSTTNTQTIGINDISNGLLNIYGDATGTSNGGEIRLFDSADYDTTNNYWSIKNNADAFFIRPESLTTSGGIFSLSASESYLGYQQGLGALSINASAMTYHLAGTTGHKFEVSNDEFFKISGNPSGNTGLIDFGDYSTTGNGYSIQLDQANLLLNASEGNIIVQDEAYSIVWDGSSQVPTKNAIYDKIESLVVGGSGDVTAASAFGSDNKIIRSDGTGKGVQVSGITLDDTNHMSGLQGLTMTPTGNIDINYVTSTSGTRIGDGFVNTLGIYDVFGNNMIQHSAGFISIGDNGTSGTAINNTSYLNAYGDGTITGTPTYNLSVDSSGKIIETANPATGTTDYVSNVSLVGNNLTFTGVGSAFNSTVDLSSLGSGSYLTSTDIDTFSELNAIVADKTLANLEDAQTITGTKTFETGDGSTNIISRNGSTSALGGVYAETSSSGDAIYIFNEIGATGRSIYSLVGGAGNSIVSNIQTGGTGYNFIGQNHNVNTFTVNKTGDVVGNTFNGVALTTAGSATNFLNEQGDYIAVPADYVSNVSLVGTDLTFTGVGNAFNSTVDLSSLSGSSISDAVYDGTWNGDTTNGASKNAIYDKIESVIAGSGATASVETKSDWNGINDTWTVTVTPNTGHQLFANNVYLVENVDYTISGNTITYTTAPLVGEVHTYFPNVVVSSNYGTNTGIGTALNMSGKYQYNFGAASSATTFTMTNISVGGYAETLINTTSEPVVTGATKLPNTASWITGTNMILCVKDFNGTRKFWFLEF